MGIEQGTRTAFLAFLAEDAIGFEPGPQNSRKIWEAREESPVSLMWRPVFAAISRSSDLGYTTGPAEWRREKSDEKPFGYGQYISIWKKQKDGSWKVAVDVGGEVPGPPKTQERLELSLPVPPPAEPLKPGAAARQLREAENAFLKAAKNDSTEALIDASLENVRVYREGVYPAVGVSAAGLMLSVRRGNLIMHRLGGDISEAGDFAYSYGRYSLARGVQKERGHYLQIWRTDKGHNWKIALDYQSPMPAEGKKPES
jgi:ketosteroid isomerase-like protein